MDRKILSTLDRAANKLRNKIEGQDYFKVLLSLIFIKFLTTKTELEWENFRKDEVDSYEEFILEKGEYDATVTIVDEEFLWSNLRNSKDEDLKSKLDGVFNSLEKHQKECNSISIYKFTSSEIPVSTLRQIIELIEQEVKFSETDYVDVFGEIYEYFIAKYSTDAGRGGEFYTPHSIVNLMVAITESRFEKDSKQLKIYDPTMGSAGMLVQSLNYLTTVNQIDKEKLLFFGQELKKSTWSIAKMNFVLRGVQWDFGPKNDDTFLNDIFKDKKFNVILSNPPFNLDFHEEDYGLIRNDERFKDYGLVFGSRMANYNFFNHIIWHLEENGVAAVVMQPAAGKSTKEKPIREKYLDNDIIEAIISLPQSIFSNTSIASNIWVFNKNKLRNKGKILFLDLNGETIKENTQEVFENKKIDEIKELFDKFINNEQINSNLNYSIIKVNEIKDNFSSDLSVSNHVKIEEEVTVISKEEIAKEFKNILEKSKEINEKMEKAINLLND